MIQRPVLQKRLSIIAAILCVGVFATSPVAAKVDPLLQGTQRAQRLNQKLLTRWKSIRRQDVKSVRALGGISASVHELVLKDGSRMIVRAPKRGNKDGFVKGLAFQYLAAQMARPEIVPAQAMAKTAFAIGRIPAGYDVMLVEHAGPKFQTSDLDQNSTVRISELLRQVGATVDFLSEHTDRKRQNLMVHPARGGIRLIDPDGSFGSALKKKRIYASVFYPGSSVAYQTPQNSIEDLASPIRWVVEAIAQAKPETLAKIYGLSSRYVDPVTSETINQLAHLQSQAQSIVDKGLSLAISDYLAGFAGHLRPLE